MKVYLIGIITTLLFLSAGVMASTTFECNQVVNSATFTQTSEFINKKSLIIVDEKGMVTVQRDQEIDIIMANPTYYYDDTEMLVANDTYETRVKIVGDNKYFTLKSKSEFFLFYIINELTDSGISFTQCARK
jgi:hypothetical protein